MIGTCMKIRAIKWLWPLVLVLGLPAWFGGAWLYLRYQPDPQLGLTLSRDEALKKAMPEALARGLDVGEWDSYVNFEPRPELIRLRAAEVDRLPVPQAVISVKFHSLEKDQTFEVRFDQRGQRLGYLHLPGRTLPRETSRRSGEPPDEQVGLAIAHEALRRQLEGRFDIVKASIERGESVRGEPGIQTYRWRWPTPQYPGLIIYSEVKIRGDRLLGEGVRTESAPATSNRMLVGDRISGLLLQALLYLLLTVTLLVGIIRFFQLFRDGEVSYSRSIVLALVLTGVMCLPIWLSDKVTYHFATRPFLPLPTVVILVGGTLLYLIVGLFLGLAYGGGEGTLRESYPGKLSSLDALLSGHLLSRNVAQAVLIGAALGGWSFLVLTLRPVAGWGDEGIGDHSSWFGRWTVLSGLVGWLPEVLLTTVIGLLIPLPFLYRRLRSHARVIPIILLTLWIGSMVAEDQTSGVRLLYSGLARAPIALLAFLQFDLLAAVIALGTPLLASEILSRIGQPASAIHESGLVALTGVVVVVLTMIYLSRKGRLVSDAEVRPLYARNLSARLSMQAEVRAAREAQLRLLPDQLPRLSGVTMAAVCRPAREVGGDFYDIYQLDEDRVAIVFADGGGNGLGSALSIAFATGYLRPLIAGTWLGDQSPDDMLRSLLKQSVRQIDQPYLDHSAHLPHLVERLVDPVRLGIMIAIIDRADMTLRYARTGPFPMIRIGSLPTPSPHSSQPATELTLSSGCLGISPGTIIVISSDGVERNSPDPRFLVKNLFRQHSVAGFQKGVETVIEQLASYAAHSGQDDDLTLVAVKVEEC